MAAVMEWNEILPEHKDVIRGMLDEPTRAMLRRTCRAEKAAHDVYLERHDPEREQRIDLLCMFGRACRHGYLGICQWIYNVVRTWRIRQKLTNVEIPFASRLCYDNALIYGHLAIADWAYACGLALLFNGFPFGNVIINNQFASLHWAMDHGFGRPRCIAWTREPLDMSMLRWLVDECHLLPTARHIEQAFEGLPATRDNLDYFRTLPTFARVDIENLLIAACMTGHWAGVDWFVTHYPAHMAYVARRLPGWHPWYAQRKTVPPRHFLRLDTGELCAPSDEAEDY